MKIPIKVRSVDPDPECHSETNAEFIRFLRYARRSCTEVQSEFHVASDEECKVANRKREPDNLSSFMV